MASPAQLRSQLRSRRDPADENVQPVSEADHRAIEWLRSQGIDPRDHTPGERVQMWRDRDVPPFDPSSPEERANNDPIPYRPNGLGPIGASPGWRPSDHDARTPEWYDEQYGHWGSLIRQLEGGQDWGPYRRLEAAQRLEQLGPDLVAQYGHGFDPTAGIEGGDYTGERDTRAPAAENDPRLDGPWADLAAHAGYELGGARPSDAMPLPFLEPRTEEERAADQSMAADRARQQGGGTPPPSAARRWGITPPPLRMTTAAAEMPGPNTLASAGDYRDQFGKIAGGWGRPSTGTTGGFAGKNWYYGNQESAAANTQAEGRPEGPTPISPLQSQKGREGPKKSPADLRFPVQNVLDVTGMSARELGRQIGLANTSQLSKGLSVDMADRIAVALGMHPIDIWPDFHAGIDTAGVQPQSTNAAERRIVPPNTAMSSSVPYEGDRPPFPPEWDVNNPEDRQAHFENVYGQLLNNLVGTFGGAQNPAGGAVPAEDLPRVGPGSAYSQGRNVVRPGDLGLPSFWDHPDAGELGAGELRTQWLKAHPEYQVAQDFTDPTDYPVDIPAEGQAGDAATRGGHFFGGDEYDRYWAGPQAGVSKNDQARLTNGGGTNRKPELPGPNTAMAANPGLAMPGLQQQGMPGPNTAMGRTLPTGDTDMRPWWLRLVDQVSGGPGMHGPDVNFPPLNPSPSGNVTPLYDWENPPDTPGPNTAMAGASSQPMWRSLLHGWGNGNTAMSTTTPDGGDEPIIPDWMTPQDVTDFWDSYPPMPDPNNPQPAHPSMGGGGALPPGYKPYVPGEQPEPTSHIQIPGAWDYGGEPMRVPVDPGYDNRHVEALNIGDQMAEWVAAAQEADRNNRPIPPMPGGFNDPGLSAMGGGAAVPRSVGGFGSQFRPRALGGYQPARTLAPLGGFGHPRSLPPMGGIRPAGGVPSSTSMNPAVRSFQSGPRHEPFDGLLENLQRNSGKIAVGTAIGLGAIASGIGRTLSPFGG